MTESHYREVAESLLDPNATHTHSSSINQISADQRRKSMVGLFFVILLTLDILFTSLLWLCDVLVKKMPQLATPNGKLFYFIVYILWSATSYGIIIFGVLYNDDLANLLRHQ